MFERLKEAQSVSMKQVEDIVGRLTKKHQKETKKNQILLIILISVVVLAIAGFVLYKVFFAPVDEYDDFYDEFDDDFDDIDFDDELDMDED